MYHQQYYSINVYLVDASTSKSNIIQVKYDKVKIPAPRKNLFGYLKDMM